MAGRDINGMQARNWKKADVSAVLSHSVKSKSDNVELFSAIKDVVVDSVAAVRGGAWDDRYRSVVDMLMSRIRAAVEKLGGKVDAQQFSESLSDAISDKLSDVMLGESVKLSDVSIGKLADILQASVDELSAQSTGAPDEGSENNDENASYAEKTYNESGQTVPEADSSSSPAAPSIEQNVEKSLRQLDRITYSPKYIESIKTFAKNIDDQVNSIGLLQGLDELDASSIQDVNPVGRYIALAQEKLHQVYEAVQKCLDAMQARRVLYEGEVKKQRGLSNKEKKQAKGINVLKYGFHAMYLDHVQKTAAAQSVEIGKFGDSVLAKQAITLNLLNKVYKLVKPKSLLDKIIDWIKEKVVKKAINKLIKKLFDSCPLVQYFKERLGPKFKAIKDQVLNKLKTVFKGVKAMFKAGFKIVKKIIGGIWKILKKVFQKAVRGVLKSIKAVLKLIYNLAKGLGKLLWSALKSIYGFFKNMFKNFLSKLKGKFTKFFGKLKGAFSKIKNFFKKPGEMFKRVKGFFKNVGTKLKNLAKGAKNFLSNLKKKAINALKNVAKKLKNVFKSIVKAVKNAVQKIVKTIVKKIAAFARKVITKIMKKIGLGVAKKMAKKKAKKMGMKILINFVKKFAVKLIAKLSAKIAATAAVNVIPILGQIISICMMIWTIVDTIMMVWDIYKLFKENPGLMDIVKEQVAEWASKAFNFFKDLAKWAANLFSNLMAGFKAVFHCVGDALFASNKRMNATRMRTLNDLKYFTIRLMKKHSQEQRTGEGGRFSKSSIKDIDYCFNQDFAWRGAGMIYWRRIRDANDSLAEEDDSWWRDTDKMTDWILCRFENFKHLFDLCADYGIFFTRPGQYYSDYFLKMVSGRIQAERKRLKEQIEEEARQRELDRYRNLRLNFAGLKEILQKMGDIVKERQEKLEELKVKISSESAAAREKLEEMYPKEMEEYDENNFRDNDDDSEEDAA